MKIIGQAIFIVIFLYISSYYGYFELMHKRPQSIHRWRQTDSASIALNYYNKGMNPFKPEVLYLVSDHETSGYTVSEFPGYYYIIALLWKIFGYDDYIYRLTCYLLFFIGLFHLFKLTHRITKDLFWSLTVPCIFLTSTVMIYYGNSFTTDIPAFSLSITAAYYMYRYWETNRNKLFYFSLAIFLFAGLIKIVSLMPFFAILGVYVFQSLGFLKIRDYASDIKLDRKKIIAFGAVIVLIASWYYTAMQYNRIHGSKFFSTQTFPIWNMKGDEIAKAWKQVCEFWLDDYFHTSMLFVFLGMFLLVVVTIRRSHQVILAMTGFLFLQVLVYITLWFFCFEAHDYYIIHLMYFFAFLSILAFHNLKDLLSRIGFAWILKGACIYLIVYNVGFTLFRLDKRYIGWINEYPLYEHVHGITPYLRSLGIKSEDKVISLPDATPNYTLYLMNQPGWTEARYSDFNEAEIQNSIDLGAKYLILVGKEPSERPYLQAFMKHKIGQKGDVRIYKLAKK